LATLGKHDLFALKLLNVYAFVMVALVWYRLAYEIEGHRFARKVFVAILLLTPMWFYVFFLLKDMVIVLLQSFFLLVVIRFWAKFTCDAALLLLIPTIFLIMFQSILGAQNGVVLVASLLIKVNGSGKSVEGMIAAIVAVVMFGGIFLLVSNQELLFAFGI